MGIEFDDTEIYVGAKFGQSASPIKTTPAQPISNATTENPVIHSSDLPCSTQAETVIGQSSRQSTEFKEQPQENAPCTHDALTVDL